MNNLGKELRYPLGKLITIRRSGMNSMLSL